MKTMLRRPRRLFTLCVVIAACFALAGPRVAAQGGSISIAGCAASSCVLKAGADFATDAFADPWDFSNREDVAIDPNQVVGFTSFDISNGVLTAQATDKTADFAMLQLPVANVINPGKTGRKFPIDPAVYTKLAVKIYAGDSLRHPLVAWYHNDLGVTNPDPNNPGYGDRYFDDSLAATPSGYSIYVIDLTKNSVLTPWSNGPVVGLSFIPVDASDPNPSPFNFQMDWVRLTRGDNDPNAATMTISWTGGSGGAITVSDGSATYTIQPTSAASGTVNWNYGVLPPGTYTLKVGAALSRTFTINSPPVIRITDPDETGGADFATNVLQNPWDMNDANDVSLTQNVNSPGFQNSIFTGTSNGAAPPQVYLLTNQLTSDTTDVIDTTKYHRLTFDLTVDRPFDVTLGSVAQVLWGSASSPTGNVSSFGLTQTSPIVVWPGKNTYTVDLATLTTATGGGLQSANAVPWTSNQVRQFGIVPHHFAEQIPFHIDNVKLAADDQTVNSTFTIRWAGSDADGPNPATVDLYAQAAGGPLNTIVKGIPLSQGQYTWNTAGLSCGSFSIIAVASDGLNSTSQTSSGPVRVTAANCPSNPFIAVDTPTPNQVVTSAFEVGGWAADLASPGGSGVSSIDFYVQLPGGAAPGIFIGHGRLGLPRADVAAAVGPQFGQSGYHFTITGMSPGRNYTLWAVAGLTNGGTATKAVPFSVNATALMSIDVPSAEQFISAPSFDVSGWSIDRRVETLGGTSTGVDMVHVYAYPNPGSGQPPIFLGIALYGQIQRPDVASFYGNSRYLNSGYNLHVDRAVAGLAPGTYNIVTWSRSTVDGQFNNVALVQVILQ